MRRAVFLDRDGTLVAEKRYLSRPEQLEFYPGSLAALRLLRTSSLALVLVSNQSGIARGFFSEAELGAVHARLEALLAAAGLALDAIYYCPHHPAGSVPAYTRPCDCRKPGPGMLERAARELDLSLADSWVVGDKAEDLALGRGRGLRPILVRTGHGAETEAALGAEFRPLVVADLLAAARHIVSAEEGP